MQLEQYVRDVPDFPKPGIVFKDITPILSNPATLAAAIDQMVEAVRELEIDQVVGIESRGFLFGVPLAIRLGCGFTPLRKPNKLPYKTRAIEYELEYGTDKLEIHEDGVRPGQKVLMVDDLLATGGTMAAACKLVGDLGAHIEACLFLIELDFLQGRELVPTDRLISLIHYQ